MQALTLKQAFDTGYSALRVYSLGCTQANQLHQPQPGKPTSPGGWSLQLRQEWNRGWNAALREPFFTGMGKR